jgi:16S rRNA (cytosine1402-N4)-methyltransferase
MNSHIPVLLKEILEMLPKSGVRSLLDVTAGGGGHFFAILERETNAHGVAWDQDPEAKARIAHKASASGLEARVRFEGKNFREPPASGESFDFILADLGVSSFQLDDAHRGISFRSDSAPDFRMDPSKGPAFVDWVAGKTEGELAAIFDSYGEEPKAAKLARAMKSWGPEAFASARALGDKVAGALGYAASRVHPATRAFQALRIAVNDEMGALKSLLEWAPGRLAPGGRLAIISFHSLEDRIVKNRFRDLAEDGAFVILSKKPIEPGEAETGANPRSRSSKLRVLERLR